MLRLYESNSEAPVMVKSLGPELALVPSQRFTPGQCDCLEICVLALETARLGQGIAGTVFLTQEPVNIPNCYQDLCVIH